MDQYKHLLVNPSDEKYAKSFQRPQQSVAPSPVPVTPLDNAGKIDGTRQVKNAQGGAESGGAGCLKKDPKAEKPSLTAYSLYVEEESEFLKVASRALSQREIDKALKLKWKEEVSVDAKKEYEKRAADLKQQAEASSSGKAISEPAQKEEVKAAGGGACGAPAASSESTICEWFMTVDTSCGTEIKTVTGLKSGSMFTTDAITDIVDYVDMGRTQPQTIVCGTNRYVLENPLGGKVTTKVIDVIGPRGTPVVGSKAFHLQVAHQLRPSCIDARDRYLTGE